MRGIGVFMGRPVTFERLDMSLEEFGRLVDMNRTDAFYIAGLAAVALCNYRYDPEKCISMLNRLKNPHEPMNDRDVQIIKERLFGKDYIPFSYFAGAIQFNNFTPRRPYTVLVKDNNYSFYNEGWAELWLHSTGAPDDRPVRLRQRRSTQEWFLSEQMLIADINLIADEEEEDDDDPWG